LTAGLVGLDPDRLEPDVLSWRLGPRGFSIFRRIARSPCHGWRWITSSRIAAPARAASISIARAFAGMPSMPG
jgi:hypothetical protein